MSDRIVFRARNRGVCVAEDVGSIKAVSICEPRVKFIKGWLTGGTDPADGSVECGAGTEYPMLVTANQLAEIFYRIRDSTVSGEIGVDYDGSLFSTFSVSTATPEALVYYGTQTIETEGDEPFTARFSHRRGYHLQTYNFPGSPSIPAHLFGEPYNIEWETVTQYRDTLDSERSMWFKLGYQFFGGAGLSHESDSNGDYPIFTPVPGHPYFTPAQQPGSAFAIMSLQVRPYVAWVGEGHPLDSDSQLFVKVEFDLPDIANGVYFPVSARRTGVVGDWNYGTPTELPNGLTFILASGSVSCPLYTYPSDEYGSYALSGGLTVTATERWTYKTTAGDDAWDTSTGSPANGGPGA